MSNDDENTLSEPFWIFDGGESLVIDTIFCRRFPETYSIFAESLESADPMDIVYPDNPNEYSDVIREMIVLLALRTDASTHFQLASLAI